MSDVSKTNEALIAEAQQHYSEMNGLNSRAAEVMMELVAALESATRVPEQGEASVAIERVRAIHQREVIAVHPGIGEEAWCPACQEHWPCSTVAALDGAPEPEWEEVVQYGNLTSAGFLQEIRGRNYAMHKRVVRFGPVLPAQGESDD